MGMYIFPGVSIVKYFFAAMLFASMAVVGPCLAQPRVVCDGPVHDFGVKRSGESVTYAFEIRNAGDAVLTVHKVETPCGCTVAALEKQRLGPGQSAKVAAVLSLEGRSGPQHKRVVLHTNDPDSPTLHLVFWGEALALADVRPRQVLFGSVDRGKAVGEPVEKSVDLVVDPQTRLAVKRVSVAVPLSQRETAGYWRARLETRVPESVYRVVVTLQPGAVTAEDAEQDDDGGRDGMRGQLRGQLRATLLIETDHPGVGTLRVPVSAVLSDELSVTPREIVLTDELSATRYIVVTKGAERAADFAITGVTPPHPDAAATIKPAGQRGYVIAVTGLSSEQYDAAAGRVVIETDVASMPRIEVPVRREGRP